MLNSVFNNFLVSNFDDYKISATNAQRKTKVLLFANQEITLKEKTRAPGGLTLTWIDVSYLWCTSRGMLSIRKAMEALPLVTFYIGPLPNLLLQWFSSLFFFSSLLQILTKTPEIHANTLKHTDLHPSHFFGINPNAFLFSTHQLDPISIHGHQIHTLTR